MSEIVNGAGINNVNAHVKKNRSRFPLKEVFADTHRFGEYHPHFVMDGISGDKHPFRCIHDARSYTLKAPLMQDLMMNKDYFMVPLRAILPLQAERVVTHPTLGDDVPADAYTSVSNFLDKVITFASSFNSALVAEYGHNTPAFMTLHLKWMVFLESIFSNGSLMASLGCNLNSCLSIESTGQNFDSYDMDSYFDKICGYISSELVNGSWEVIIDGVKYYLSLEPMPRGHNYFAADRISMHDFLQKIRDTSDWSFVTTALFDPTKFLEFDPNDVQLDYNSLADFPLDLCRLWAYHLVVAEYFSNDKVDYIYSADLFRQYIYSLWLSAGNSSISFVGFSWNGSRLLYDYLSSHFFNIFAGYNFSNSSLASRIPILQYFLTLFGYHRSLRFKDYFTGSRTRPLAIVTSRANTDVPVVGGNVSVIDVTRSIQVQRFLNAVNAAGRKYGEYIDALFGVRPNQDMHEPIFLAHTSDSLFASEVENTGSAQQTEANSVTAIFRGNSNNFEYSVAVDEPCIIIGVTSYDIERLYPDTIQRSWFIRDRFDMFIPEMQYIGDQQVYQHELCAGFDTAFGTAFGYQFRDMQWKQLFPRCAGGFASRSLPGYSFVYERPMKAGGVVISPDFIRSKNSELDQFYLSLTGFSLGTYFHFIVKQINVDDASREMIAQPQIL